MKAATVNATPTSGSRLLEACNFDRRLTASIIATRPDWEQLLATIPAPDLRKNVAAAVWQIREALGQEAEYAREITQGEI